MDPIDLIAQFRRTYFEWTFVDFDQFIFFEFGFRNAYTFALRNWSFLVNFGNCSGEIERNS